MLQTFFIVKYGIACFLCTMRVFEVRASSSSPRLPLCQIAFLSRSPLLSYGDHEKRKITCSISHSITQLIWCPENRSLRFEWFHRIQVMRLPSPRFEAQASGWCCMHSTFLPILLIFPSPEVVLRAFSALCVYSKLGHHPHSLGYLCAKSRFFRGLHCWASPWRKIVYSLTQLTWCPGNQSLRFRIVKHKKDKWKCNSHGWCFWHGGWNEDKVDRTRHCKGLSLGRVRLTTDCTCSNAI